MAPEIIQKGMVSLKSDIYSCGILLCTMILGFNPLIGGGCQNDEEIEIEN